MLSALQHLLSLPGLLLALAVAGCGVVDAVCVESGSGPCPSDIVDGAEGGIGPDNRCFSDFECDYESGEACHLDQECAEIVEAHESRCTSFEVPFNNADGDRGLVVGDAYFFGVESPSSLPLGDLASCYRVGFLAWADDLDAMPSADDIEGDPEIIQWRGHPALGTGESAIDEEFEVLANIEVTEHGVEVRYYEATVCRASTREVDELYVRMAWDNDVSNSACASPND